jgi:hypothetical protein
METILAKFPKKADLVRELMSLLGIEQEAAYRRLRGDVPFTVHEVVKLALTWNLSLDEIANIDSDKISFMMKPINYFDPSEKEMETIQKRVRRLEHLRSSANSECMEICNKLPKSLTAGFPALYQFDIFRWAYQYGDMEEKPLFAKIKFSDQFLQELADYYQLIKHMSSMSYILDYMIFEYMVRDIQYFHSILLITTEEKESIKQSLHELLDYLEDVASKGSFPETKKKVNLYVSKVNVSTNYSYIYTEKLKICRIHAFEKYDIASYNTEMVNRFRAWMQLKRRTSIQISEVDEKSRVEFFVRQRHLVDGL